MFNYNYKYKCIQYFNNLIKTRKGRTSNFYYFKTKTMKYDLKPKKNHLRKEICS